MRLPGKSTVEDIEGLARLLKQAGVKFCAEDIADALWLAEHMEGPARAEPASANNADRNSNPVTIREEVVEDDAPPDPSDRVSLVLPNRQRQPQGDSPSAAGIAIKAPAAPALRIRLDLARALRPLRRQVPSPGRLEFDEAATLDQIADQQVWLPVLRPSLERWLEVALVVEAMPALPLWEETISEFQTLLERQGAFRRVTTWRLETDGAGPPRLFPHWQRAPQGQKPRQANQLWDAAGRRLILLLSDCTAAAWYDGTLVRWLAPHSRQAPLAVVQLLPERLWPQSALAQGTSLWLRAQDPGTASAQLKARPRVPLLQQLLALTQTKPAQGVTVPIVTLEADPLKQWAKMVAGVGDSQTLGVRFDLATLTPQVPTGTPPPAPSPDERVQRFRTTASLMAQRLAELMAVVPVSPPIVDLLRQTLLPGARPVHVAEVYMGGLMVARPTDPDAPQATPLAYDFAPGVRPLLTDVLSKRRTRSVLDAVSQYIAARLGLNIRSFEALLQIDVQDDPAAQDWVLPFAELAIPTLQRMGGAQAALADQLQAAAKVPPPMPPPDLDDLFPLLQTFPFREATLVLDPPDPGGAGPDDGLTSIPFETAVIDATEWRQNRNLVIRRSTRRAGQYVEALGRGVDLALVSIPAGTFTMGSPEEEEGRDDRESPQHEVTLAEPFWMAQTPITQAQWRAVAALPQQERKLNPDPSRFKGENRPVEMVSWLDAVEFCRRLAEATGRPYRLPTEAEWEYACRAGTTTPFHFGPTVTTDLANYDGNYTYGGGPKGEYRQETTEVGRFPANRFGLYDMHGNVREWCQDWYHKSYAGAPVDGSAWLTHEEDAEERRVLRGGSWDGVPEFCRSAYRVRYAPDFIYLFVGCRVVCGGART